MANTDPDLAQRLGLIPSVARDEMLAWASTPLPAWGYDALRENVRYNRRQRLRLRVWEARRAVGERVARLGHRIAGDVPDDCDW
jgi:hypothetical protein